MELQEPRFDKDMKDVEFRPQSYCGPSLPSPSRDSDAVARRVDFHYYRPMDCYLSRQGLADARRADAIAAA